MAAASRGSLDYFWAWATSEPFSLAKDLARAAMEDQRRYEAFANGSGAAALK